MTRTNKPFWPLPLLLLAAIVLPLATSSCSSDNDDDGDKPTPTEESTTGDITFSISNAGGSGTGSSQSPAVVNQGDTLQMAVSQRSSYTDPDGSVFTCEPKATIRLFAETDDTLYVKDLQTLTTVTELQKSTIRLFAETDDTLYVKDLQTLTTVTELQKSTSSTTAVDCRTERTVQRFDVGGRVLDFDLAYEVYTYVNSRQKTIEMPYVRLGAARYGATHQQEATRSQSPVVTGIRLTPCTDAPTRGSYTSAQVFDVDVLFNLDAESQNTKTASTQNLSFDAKFTAVVETTTEYPDPTKEFFYTLDVLSGTKSTASPFVLNNGETLALQYNQTSRYNYFSLTTYESQTVLYEPKAKISLKAAKDTVYVENKDAIEQLTISDPIITTSGANPATTTGQQVYTLGGGQTLTLDWSYDAYGNISANDEDVAMPYLKFDEAEIVNVKAEENADAVIPGKDAKVYDVTVTLRQKASSVNAQEAKTETIEYVVKYTAVQEVKLVRITYRKDYYWKEPEYNLMLRYFPIVYRDRLYSTGETFTDTFQDYAHVGDIHTYFDPGEAIEGGVFLQPDGENVVYSAKIETRTGDSIEVCTGTMGVPNLEVVRETIIEWCPVGQPLGSWDDYVVSKLYEGLDVSVDGVEIVGSNGNSDRASGWYFFDPVEETCIHVWLGPTIYWGGYIRKFVHGFTINSSSLMGK